MYRMIIPLSASLLLTGCASGGLGPDTTSTPAPARAAAPAPPPAPATDLVRFESSPAGARVKISDAQSCRTPCAMDLPMNRPTVVAFSLPGYLIVSKAVEPKVGINPVQLEPNPVTVDFIADPALTKKTASKVRPRKPAGIPTAPPSSAPAR